MTNNAGRRSPHVLVIPFPAQGHMLPLLDFTHQLALRVDSGTGSCGCSGGLRSLTITILVTPKNLPMLNPLLSQHYSSSVIIETLVLPFPTHHSIPQGIENVKDLPPSYFVPFMRAMGELYNPIYHWFGSNSSPPSVIISDFFLGWTHHLACELNIPRIAFCPSGALTLAISAYVWRELPKRDDDSNDENAILSFSQIPNCPSFPWWQISPFYRGYIEGIEGNTNLEYANYASWGMVFNSFIDLEGVYLEHLKKDLGHQRVWGVGPLLIPDSSSSSSSKSEVPDTERGGFSSVLTSDVLSWLDTCDDGSVVYICFGSQAVLNNKQMEELATGLDQSGVRFIWATKGATIGHVSTDYGLVPEWFEDKYYYRHKGRGLLIKGWAPQVLILKHRAVGSFLTHCGWNSVMEAVVAGVPMLAWPMGADQFINTTLLVDQMNVAVRVCEGDETIPNAAELARVLADSVTMSSSSKPGDYNEENNNAAEASKRKRRAIELSKASIHAVKEGGSSLKDLDALVNSLFGA